tara:strand:+ start:1059 stop:1718 length:660 start_codon:yes stop_codon:yes gene_type:complete
MNILIIGIGCNFVRRGTFIATRPHPLAFVRVIRAAAIILVVTKMHGVETVARVGGGVWVQASTLPGAGNGLFAGRPFKSSEYITLYDGETLTRTEAWSRPTLSHMASREGVIVDGLSTPLVGRGGGSFSNSARCDKEANASIVAVLGELFLRARRAIGENEEILVYYGRRGFALSCESATMPKVSTKATGDARMQHTTMTLRTRRVRPELRRTRDRIHL